MNRDHWAKMLPIITAFVEGKTVQFRLTTNHEAEWRNASDINDLTFSTHGEYHWRIKPEPKLRPWKPEEVPVGTVVRNVGMGSRRMIVSVSESGVSLGGLTDTWGLTSLLTAYELLDGSPCGVICDE